MTELSNQAKEAQRAYLREWRRKNPEKVRESNRGNWERKAAQLEQEQPERGAENTDAELLAVGAENGLTSRQLSQLTGLDTRTIQARISAERLSGVPICSDTLNGFYMPSNDEEKARCIRSLRRRGIEILRVAEAMNRIPGDGQMELHIGEMDER